MKNKISEHTEIKGMVAGRVLQSIPHGRKNAVTRQRLTWLTGMNDRAVRECIEQLRDEGELICNDQDGKGYYLAETVEEIERQHNKDRARALSILKRLKPFRAELRKAGRL